VVFFILQANASIVSQIRLQLCHFQFIVQNSFYFDTVIMAYLKHPKVNEKINTFREIICIQLFFFFRMLMHLTLKKDFVVCLLYCTLTKVMLLMLKLNSDR
jgi:hypothetical protein